VFAIVTILISKRLMHSRLGRGLRAIRDDDIAAEAMGINIVYLKVLAFILGACIAGAAGSFFAVFIRYINPDNFTYMESVSILCMVVLGGVGNITGVVFGAIILTILPEALRDISTYRYVIYGMLLIMMMIIRPNGLIGEKGGNLSGKSTGVKRSNKVFWRINSSK
ncbi:MAG: branched-chain amino acid ABC transporter permease, partial [Clostridium sp.]